MIPDLQEYKSYERGRTGVYALLCTVPAYGKIYLEYTVSYPFPHPTNETLSIIHLLVTRLCRFFLEFQFSLYVVCGVKTWAKPLIRKSAAPMTHVWCRA